jgi:proline dehydrogenase
MLRSFFIFLSKNSLLQRLVSEWGIAWKAASRFVAGTTINDAINCVRDQNIKGFNCTLDHLGESTTTQDESIRATKEIVELIEKIQENKIRSNISIKLTQIGLSLGEELCEKNLQQILKIASSINNFVRIDMEDTSYTDKTINMYLKMRNLGFENTGLVVQAYLYRTEKDAHDLLKIRTPFRLVKGAYKEPADLAYPRKRDVDLNFDLLSKMMIDTTVKLGSPVIREDGLFPPLPAIGSHDPKRLEYAKAYADSVDLPKKAIEFQMLYGIRRDLQEMYLKQGYPVRIYVPYGTHWYPYFMRRLAERPENVLFFLSNLFKK